MALARTTNFATAKPRPVLLVAVTTWIIACGLAVALFWAVRETWTLRSEQTRLTGHVERLKADIARLSQRVAAAPSAEDIATQAQEITYYNTLVGSRAAPMPVVLDALAGELPTEVWLSQMTYSSETGQLSLSLQAEDEAMLPTALKVLEQNNLLDDVILQRQIRLQQGRRNFIQYEVEAVTQ